MLQRSLNVIALACWTIEEKWEKSKLCQARHTLKCNKISSIWNLMTLNDSMGEEKKIRSRLLKLCRIFISSSAVFVVLYPPLTASLNHWLSSMIGMKLPLVLVLINSIAIGASKIIVRRHIDRPRDGNSKWLAMEDSSSSNVICVILNQLFRGWGGSKNLVTVH